MFTVHCNGCATITPLYTSLPPHTAHFPPSTQSSVFRPLTAFARGILGDLLTLSHIYCSTAHLYTAHTTAVGNIPRPPPGNHAKPRDLPARLYILCMCFFLFLPFCLVCCKLRVDRSDLLCAFFEWYAERSEEPIHPTGIAGKDGAVRVSGRMEYVSRLCYKHICIS